MNSRPFNLSRFCSSSDTGKLSRMTGHYLKCTRDEQKFDSGKVLKLRGDSNCTYRARNITSRLNYRQL
jgi:hypothetical protein